MSHEFEVRREQVVKAAPEQAWDAVNTGEGLASWLFPMGEGSPEGEGSVWGGHRLVTWDPPRHSVARMEDEDGNLVNQLEHEIVDQGDGTLLLRYVHSGVLAGDDWEHQYDGIDIHTDFYQHTLAQYLTHFVGRHAAYIGAEGPQASTEPGSFQRVQRALGVEEGASVGDRVSFAVDGYGTVDGTIDYLNDWCLGIRSDDAMYRFFGRESLGAAPNFAGHHLFAPGVDQAAAQQAWQRWIDGVFAKQSAHA